MPGMAFLPTFFCGRNRLIAQSGEIHPEIEMAKSTPKKGVIRGPKMVSNKIIRI
jgi:hypothetical protein